MKQFLQTFITVPSEVEANLLCEALQTEGLAAGCTIREAIIPGDARPRAAGESPELSSWSVRAYTIPENELPIVSFLRGEALAGRAQDISFVEVEGTTRFLEWLCAPLERRVFAAVG